MEPQAFKREIVMNVGDACLSATLAVPPDARGVILFAHGSGSSRHSPRNRYVARVLQKSGFATLLLDLMRPEEDRLDAHTGHLRFNIDVLAKRLVAATGWVGEQPSICDLPISYFGASTGAAAALVAASRLPETVQAIVSRGGRPDLAGDCLADVRCPTLLIVGGADRQVVSLNFAALDQLAILKRRLQVIMGAGHLFEEPGALEQVAASACDWFDRHLASAEAAPPKETVASVVSAER